MTLIHSIFCAFVSQLCTCGHFSLWMVFGNLYNNDDFPAENNDVFVVRWMVAVAHSRSLAARDTAKTNKQQTFHQMSNANPAACLSRPCPSSCFSKTGGPAPPDCHAGVEVEKEGRLSGTLSSRMGSRACWCAAERAARNDASRRHGRRDVASSRCHGRSRRQDPGPWPRRGRTRGDPAVRGRVLPGWLRSRSLPSSVPEPSTCKHVAGKTFSFVNLSSSYSRRRISI